MRFQNVFETRVAATACSNRFFDGTGGTNGLILRNVVEFLFRKCCYSGNRFVGINQATRMDISVLVEVCAVSFSAAGGLA